MTNHVENALYDRMAGMETVLENVPTEMYGPVHYLVLLQEHGGFDALRLKRVPSEITSIVADKMGISVATLNSRRAKWNDDQLLAKARAILQPYFDEQLAVALDYAQSAIPVLIYRLVEKALDPEAGYGVTKDALATLMRLSETHKPREKDKSTEDDEQYILGLGSG